ncbi:Glucokinase [hydrothermal vent metagenome]|uniref:Glucokinase n=1 Tax=hydrothermal vent metagenome TaxID=652676 RepID=A0A3B0RQ24_9ZZZZ
MGREIVVADIGGTHARFAIANIDDGKVIALTDQIKMQTSEHASLQIAWETYGRKLARELPRDGAIAIAGPVSGEMIYFTNSSWMIRPALIPETLKLNRFTLINDFGAVGHAVAQMDADMFRPVCGPDKALTNDGIITVVGPGTGLGVAHILRVANKGSDDYQVTETEGGHIDFAPLDHTEDQLLAHLRQHHRRVSVERLASGPGLATIYQVLAQMEQQQVRSLSDTELWKLATSGKDSLAAAAFDRFCLCLGGIAGDLALAQGAKSVVMAGGLGRRIADRLPSSGFRERFVAKGRFQSKMEAITVKQLLHEEPGLYGAAAAFVQEHGAWQNNETN